MMAGDGKSNQPAVGWLLCGVDQQTLQVTGLSFHLKGKSKPLLFHNYYGES
jgi:hypothetical protein